jgi:hypothetical protein
MKSMPQILLLVVLLVSCDGGGNDKLLGPPPDPALARAESAIALAGFAERLNAGDIDGALAFVSRQGVLTNDIGRYWELDRHQQTVFGHAGIREFLTTVLAGYSEYHFEFALGELDQDGWISWGAVTYSFTGIPLAPGPQWPEGFAEFDAFTFQYESGQWLIYKLGDYHDTHNEGIGGNI